MIDETLLLAAVYNSREAYDRAQNIGIEREDLGEAAWFVYEAIGQQYKRDRDQQKGDSATLKTQAIRRFGEGPMADSVMDFVSSFPEDTSAVNVVEEYRLLRIGRAATELATALATGQDTEELLETYKKLKEGEDDAGAPPKLRLSLSDFTQQAGERIPLWPKRLNSFIGGGVVRGNNITVYGRPDSGKSMFALNMAALSCRNGYKVLYVANEEPDKFITKRLLSRMCNTPVGTLDDPEKLKRAFAHAGDAYERWTLLHKAGVTLKDIRRMAALVKPDIIVIDQLQNVSTKDDNRALQLDALARGVRELGIEFNAVTISVTQAGGSGRDQLKLKMEDVDWSNTGIPGAADLMIGIGVNEEWDKMKKRMLCLPKNKINGVHGEMHVFVEPQYTAFMSKKMPRKYDDRNQGTD